MKWIAIIARYEGTCAVCGLSYDAKALIRWEKNSKKTVHNKCFLEIRRRVHEKIDD